MRRPLGACASQAVAAVGGFWARGAQLHVAGLACTWLAWEAWGPGSVWAGLRLDGVAGESWAPERVLCLVALQHRLGAA